MKAREKNRIAGPFPYETKFSADNLVTSLVIDPLRGLGILVEAQMNDMLENYRFNGGIMSTLDLKNGDVFAEFQYLPHFLDFNVRFDRRAVRWDPYLDKNQYKYNLHKLEVGVSLPFTDRMRLTMKPFGAIASSINLGPQLLQYVPGPPSSSAKHTYYAGAETELVYDNSVSTGMNLREGSRGKVGMVHYQGLKSNEFSFTKAFVDLRHYQKIYREIVFAVRGFGGTFFGNSPKFFLLGGMNNWAFNRTDLDGITPNGEANPLNTIVDAGGNSFQLAENQDILFVEYATNLRGFNYSTLFGNSVLLMNAELRIPLVRALSNGPIASNFFRNLQFIGFYDIGTSWSGSKPFSQETSVSYSVIRNGPFTAKIKNYLNPWLYSYGVGVRTVVFSYYVKFDLAWPVENYNVGKPRGFLTLGFDF
jgi:outer membrane protein assembly factor BamA